ncbi:alpha-aspartyl dipeptidase-like [Pelobates cultripes]|uniref:dipeptidase E n=1 Tax=Pelobates cultripes TaxID=61616 RepID=A0AAD1SPM5_PELCU|nr:alpha-aspartyl dipeptidase-like [Pelobates cultripes]
MQHRYTLPVTKFFGFKPKNTIVSNSPSTMTTKRRLLLISNSTLHGGGYLEHCQEHIVKFLGKQVKRVLFVPYALHGRDDYAKIARQKFESLGYGLDSVHEAENPVEAVQNCQAIFIGGGNTFRLLKALYDNNLIPAIRKKVLEDGIPYIGSSAGTNVATITINTTNDMPIVYPPSLHALGLVPFNINPHYLDPDANSKHMGETREQRITQYHEEQDTPPVLAIREGCLLLVEGDKATLLGVTGARLFQRGKATSEHDPGHDFSFLLAHS